MHGTRIIKREYQCASLLLQKGKQVVTLQGMIHWGTDEFFRQIQDQINQCRGIILFEDTNYLDPADLVKLSDEDFYELYKKMARSGNKTLEMMTKLLDLKYQWDMLRYPTSPHALCADASWHEMNEFNKYCRAISKESPSSTKKAPAREKTWDLLIKEDRAGRVLLFEIMYQCFRNWRTERKTGKTRIRLSALFERWNKYPGFKNPTKARGVFEDLISYYGSGDPDHEPEDRAFWFDKRERRVFDLVKKIEKLETVEEILILYGAGHLDALKKGLEKLGWKFTGTTTWKTVFVYPFCTTAEMMRALDSITSN